MKKKIESVIVLGASSNPSRYSHSCTSLLKEKRYKVIPVNPNEKEVCGISCRSSLKDLIKEKEKIHTVTVYVNPKISLGLKEDLKSLSPKRVIFNPGAENPSLYSELQKEGIEVVENCTLVLLRTNQF